jgi:DNA polymerase-3 subunit beta
MTDVTNLEELLGSDDETAVITIASTADLAFATKKFVLQAQLEKAAFVLPSKDHIPVLKHFQIEVSDDGLRVMATDLELSVLASTPVIAQERRVGTAMFPGVKFLQLIKEAADSDIHVDVHDGYAHIECGPTTWNLRLRDGAEYPDLPNVAEVEFHKINRVKFLGGIAAVRYAAAHDQTRTNLMMIDFTNGKMVACDGARYQEADLIGKEARKDGASFPLSLQIPIGAVPNLLKLLKTTEGEDILIGETDNALVFNIGSDMFVANKLTVSFPDMDTLLKRPAMENHEVLTVDRQELIEAVRRVRITADPETSAIVLALAPNELAVRTKDKYGNESDQAIHAGWAEESREIAVNHAYLSDMLEMTDSKTCTFKLGPDTKTKKASLVLEDEETDSVGILSTMRPDWLT